MRVDVAERLVELSRQEYQSSQAGGEDVRGLYGRSGRFIIERRRVSYISTGKTDEPISLRVHPVLIEFPEHSHDFIELMYVWSGSITHRIGEGEVTVGEGDMILFGKGARHSVAMTGVADIGINIVISTELFEALISDIRRSSSLDTAALASMLEGGADRHLLINTADNESLRSLIESIVHSGLMTECDGYVMRASVALLLSYLATSPEGSAPSREARARRLCDYLTTSYASATLGEAAELLGISPAYLSRWCRERLGRSFKELVTEERFSAACELLAETDMQIGEIIATVGYENSSYFHREFKRRCGKTPKEYRDEHLNPVADAHNI